MKKYINIGIRSVVLMLLIIVACTHEVDIKTDFMFEVNFSHNEEGFMRDYLENTIQIVPERKVKGVKYSFSYKVKTGEGEFHFQPDTALEPLRDYPIEDLENFEFKTHYYAKKLGENKVEITIKDSNGQENKYDLIYNIKYADFTFIFNKSAEEYPIGVKSPFALTLLNNKDGDQDFKITYNIEDGDGKFYNADTLFLEKGETHLVKEGVATWRYEPDVIGTHKIVATAENIDGNIIERIVEMDVRNVNWTFDISGRETSTVSTENMEVTVDLNTIDTNNNPTYKYYIEVLENDGDIIDDQNNIIVPGERADIVEGTKTFNFKPRSLGDTKIMFYAIDNYNEVKRDSLQVRVERVPYTFTAASTVQDIQVNELAPINFGLDPQGNFEGLEYNIKYVINNGEGVMLDENNQEIPIAQNKEVNPGDWTWKFKPSSVTENTSVTFTIIDSYGEEKTQEVNFNVSNVDFDFSVTPSQVVHVNQWNQMTFSLVPSGDQTDIAYKMSYDLIEGSGVLGKRNSNTRYDQNVPFDVQIGTYSLDYIPSSVGVHKINFKAISNTGRSKTIPLEIEVVSTAFSFTANATNSEIFKNYEDNIALSLQQQQGNNTISYTLEYNIVGNGKLYKDNTEAPASQTIEPGNYTNYKFSSEVAGNSTINFKITDSNGTEQTQELIYVVNNTDFTINSSGDGNLFINEDKPILFSISQESEDSSASYQYKYEVVNGSGKLKTPEGVEVPLALYQDAEVGINNLVFTSDYIGETKILITSKDNYGHFHTTELLFNTNNIEYNFNATSSVNELNILDEALINFSIVQNREVTGITYTMNYETNSEGVLIGSDGIEKVRGVDFDVQRGVFTMKYKPSRVGEHTLTFKTKSSSGVERTKQIFLNVTNINFALSATVPSTVYVNEQNPFAFSLVEQGSPSGATFTMEYNVLQGAGKFYNGNSIVNESIPFDVNTGDFGYTFLPSEAGTTSVEFTVKTNTGAELKVVKNFEVIATDFSLRVFATDTNIAKNEEDKITVSLQQNATNSNITYTLEYNIVGNGTLYKDNSEAPASESITPGNYNNYKFVSSEAGASTINFTINDSNGQTESQQLIYTVSNPSFDLNTIGGTELYLNDSEDFTFNITQQYTDNQASYQYSYEFVQGNGELKDSSGSVIVPGSYYDASVGLNQLNFEAIRNGINTVKLTVRDNYGNTQYREITFTVNEISFDYSAASASANIAYGEDIKITQNISSQVENGNIQYELSYTTSGTGTLSYNGVDYSPGEVIDVSDGQFNTYYKGLSVGTHEIIFSVKSTQNITKTSQVRIDVSSIDFNFLADAQDNSIYKNEETNINFDISESVGSSSDTYEVSYSLTRGGGILKDITGTALTSSTFYTVSSGPTNWIFEGTDVGEVEIKLIARNSTGTSREVKVQLEVKQTDFVFQSIVAESAANINEEVPVSFVLTPNGEENLTYDLLFSSTVSGKLKLNGTSYNAGQQIVVTPGNFVGSFTSSVPGTNDITFEVTASNNVKKTDNITIDFGEPDYSFSADIEKTSMYKEESSDINFNISQSGSALNYEIAYIINSGNAVIKDRNGTILNSNSFYSVPLGSSNWVIEGSDVGNVDVTFKSKNSTGTEKNVNDDIIVNKTDFNFTAIAAQTSSFVNEIVPINFVLTRLGTENLTYKMVYSSSLNGSLKIGTTTYSAGEEITINPGNFNAEYIGENQGNHDIEFRVTASNAIAKSDNTKIDVSFLDFTLTADSQDNSIYKNESTNLNFNISQAGNPLTYEMSYTINSGNATVKNAAGSTLNSSSYYPVSHGNFNWQFIGSVEGNVSITFTARNSSGATKSKTVDITVNKTDFNFNAVSTQTTANVNEEVPVNFSLTKLGTENITYKLSFASTINSSLKMGGTTYSAGEEITVIPGNFSADIITQESGTNKVTFTVVASNNVTHNKEVTITAAPLDFTLTADSQDNSIYKNESTNLNFNISQAGNPLTYEMSYTINSGNATVKNAAGSTLNSSSYYPVSHGNFNWQFIGSVEGNVSITFTARNSSGATKSKTVDITVNKTDFNFNAVSTQTTANVNEEVPVNFSLTKLGTENITYKLSFASTINSSLKMGGTTYSAGEEITVIPGNFSADIITQESGTNKVTFTVVASNNVTHNKEVTITAAPLDFTLTADSQDNSIYKNESTNLNFNISQAGNPLTYEMSYTINSGNATIKNAAGSTLNSSSYYPVSHGNFNWQFIGSVEGNVSITFTARNSSGATKSKTVDITVNKTDFNFNAISTQTTASVGNLVPVNFTLSKLGTESISYNLSFSSTITSKLKIGGTTYTAGQQIPVNIGNFSGDLITESTGNNEVTFTITASNNVTKSDDISISISPLDFTLEGSPQQNSIYKNESTNLNFEVSQSGTPLTYEMSYVINSGNATIKNAAGSTLNSTTYYPISLGNFNWQFVGSSEGNVSITFTARNSSGAIKSKTISVEVKQTDFTFTAIAGQSSTNVNESVPVNFVLTKLGTENVTYNLVYNSSSNGTLKVGGVTYSDGQQITVNTGNFSGEYIGTSNGTHRIDFTVTASNNIVHSDSENISFNQIDFNFSGDIEETSIYKDEESNINFNLNQSGTSLSYEISYVFESGNGVIKNSSGVTLTSATYYPVNLGNFNWKFIGTNDGNVKIKFTVRNTSGTTKNVTDDITVNKTNFNFTSIETNSSSNVNQEIPINFILTKLGTENITYSMIFTSNGTGTLEIGGNIYSPGQQISVTSGNFTGNYTGTSSGNHNVTFTVVASNNITKNDNVSIEFKSANFIYSVNGYGDTIQETNTTNLILNITPEDYSISAQYKLTFTSNLNNSITYNGNTFNSGEEITLNSLNNNLIYNGINSGDDTINLSVVNNFNVTKVKNIQVKVVEKTLLESFTYECDRNYNSGFTATYHTLKLSNQNINYIDIEMYDHYTGQLLTDYPPIFGSSGTLTKTDYLNTINTTRELGLREAEYRSCLTCSPPGCKPRRKFRLKDEFGFWSDILISTEI
ncbi:protein of unknown function [Tenacibaculum sp. MAR_2009_124]|uniref:TraQ conjugal transfer family protein n=1 Tax=Tenacibaculum sp. MAR_2009_124 TaxID=1250059 RepID=UPI000896F3EB|nr:TraQ conjugal transfer family protein [Tenacibaculum sp. MAR_2009_124]SEC65676.1 protein of unknown function [Tenacibaculum sp. MAR_2009_124]